MKNSSKASVTIDNITQGMTIYDSDGKKGIVRDCKDLHNIHVTFEGTGIIVDVDGKPTDCGGSGLYCLIDGCDENSKLVDPLYF